MKTAVHLHLYYTNQLPKLLSQMHNLDKAKVEYDLYVTMVKSDKRAEDAIYKEFPKATIWKVENRGYDIGPFIDFLHRIDLHKYDYILKLHTKSQSQGVCTLLNGYYFNNVLWGEVLTDALIGSAKIIKQNYKRIKEDKNIGMIGSRYCLTSEEHVYKNLLPQIKEELTRLRMPMPREWDFVAGSMFMVKTETITPFLQAKIEDFAPTDGRIKEGTRAHIYERLFGIAIYVQNKKITGNRQHNYDMLLMYPKIKRFFFQKKQTKAGNTIVKICKLPVWHWRKK